MGRSMNLDLPHHSHHLINGKARGGPWLNNSDYLSMRESLVLTSAYVRPPAQTLGDGEKSPKATRKGGGGGGNAIFLFAGTESRGAFLATGVSVII